MVGPGYLEELYMHTLYSGVESSRLQHGLDIEKSLTLFTLGSGDAIWLKFQFRCLLILTSDEEMRFWKNFPYLI